MGWERYALLKKNIIEFFTRFTTSFRWPRADVDYSGTEGEDLFCLCDGCVIALVVLLGWVGCCLLVGLVSGWLLDGVRFG